MKKKTVIITAFIVLCCAVAIIFGVKAHHDKEVAIAKAHSEKVESIKRRKLRKKRAERRKRESESRKKKQQAQQQSSTNTEQQAGQQTTQQSNATDQDTINRQRGYDPNGAPLLPGQDHAAGSNPDGSPDAWVQWQIDHQNDTTFPDGTPFPNGGNQ